jgi:hypothetical protein
MSTNRPDGEPEGLAVPEWPRAEPGAGAGAGPAGAWPWFGQARWLVVIGGLLAGLVGFAAGEATYQVFPAEKVEQNLMGSKIRAPNRATTTEAARRNGALTFGILGVCLGTCLGMAGGLARRSTSVAVAGALLGALLGLALGAGVSWAALPWFMMIRLDYMDYDLMISLCMHGLIWGLLGASAGLAFAVGLGEPRLCGKVLAAGFVGAVLGTVAFEVVGAVVFPMAETDEPISETWATRLMARLLVTVGTALVVMLILPEPGPLPDAYRPADPAEQP